MITMTTLRYIMLCLFVFSLHKQGMCSDDNRITTDKKRKPQFILKEHCYQCKLIFQKEIDGDYHFVEGVLLPMLTKTQSYFFSQDHIMVSFELNDSNRYVVYIEMLNETNETVTHPLISLIVDKTMTCFTPNACKITLESFCKSH